MDIIMKNDKMKKWIGPGRGWYAGMLANGRISYLYYFQLRARCGNH